MNPQLRSMYATHSAETLNADLSKLPVARQLVLWSSPESNIGLENIERVKGFKAIEVTDSNGQKEIVNCPTTQYTIVQHNDAFRPIVEALVQSGVQDFKYGLIHNHRWAKLNLLVQDDVIDGVSLGFDVSNSFDGSGAVNFGLDMSRKHRTIELVGYRQVCSNGMKIKVPLDNAEIIRLETVEKVQSLMKQHTKLKHTTNVHRKIEAIQYVVEAVALLKDSVLS